MPWLSDAGNAAQAAGGNPGSSDGVGPITAEECGRRLGGRMDEKSAEAFLQDSRPGGRVRDTRQATLARLGKTSRSAGTDDVFRPSRPAPPLPSMSEVFEWNAPCVRVDWSSIQSTDRETPIDELSRERLERLAGDAGCHRSQ